MEIANPMYDAVFKFLMDDPECARILLSGLTGLDIVAIEPLPQEIVLDIVLPIYFLGERPEGFEDVPILLLDRQPRDHHTRQPLQGTNPFINALFHNGILINRLVARGIIEGSKNSNCDLNRYGMSQEVSTEQSYRHLLVALKQQVQSAQAKAALAVNSSLIQLYWNMGKMIAENQALFEGRNNYVEQLAKDLRAEFPEMKGFSRSNLFYIRKFYQFYAIPSVQQAVGLSESLPNTLSAQQFVVPEKETSGQQLVGLNFDLLSIPWGHHVVLLDKAKRTEEALFYIRQTTENNWSRAILTLQIEQDLYSRQGKAITNFRQTLPEKQALMVGQILKDPYNFSFLTLEPQVQELDVERQLTEHITKFLLELGKGFAFIGRQYPLPVGDKEYRMDLLFYHIRLRCFVVIDLKVVEFKPEFAGKMNFYLSAVDDLLKTTEDHPSIGIILCKNKNKLEVEYALRGMNKPIGVSEFTITKALPAELKSTLPTVEEFENELKNDLH